MKIGRGQVEATGIVCPSPGVWRKHYHDYQPCPFKMDRVPSAAHKQLVRSAFEATYQRAWHRQRSPQGQCMRRVRQRAVEPRSANLWQHYGRRLVGSRS